MRANFLWLLKAYQRRSLPVSSPEKIGFDGSSNGDAGPGNIPVDPSEFELVEETEKIENVHESQIGHVSSINVRSFKMLELLRLSSIDVSDSTKNQSRSHLTMVSSDFPTR